MEYQIALAPKLGLTPSDFVDTWNELDQSHTVAQARLTPSSSVQFDPFLLGMLAVLSTVGIGVGTNAIYDLIKKVFVKRGIHKHIHITQIDQPDGTHTVVVDFEEE